MQTFTIIKKYIAKQIKLNGNSCKNIILSTRQIKKGYENLTNAEVFYDLMTMENAGIIKIKVKARPRKIYKNLRSSIIFCQRICRYIIDVLQPEYFCVNEQINNDCTKEKWAIQASVDIDNWKFIVKLNGIDEDFEFNFKPAANGLKTKLMSFWEKAQNNPNTEIDCYSDDLFKRPHDSIKAFFRQFCPELQDYLISISRSGNTARFMPVVSPDILRAKNIGRLIFNKGENEKKYKCSWDESGTFLGWKRIG